MAYVITQPCIGVKDASCVDVCPVDCIEEGEDMFYIDPDVCIDCGACVAACPVDGMLERGCVEKFLPAEMLVLVLARRPCTSLSALQAM